jgi:hypothetical protein
MSQSIGNTIADSLQLCLKYGEVLLKDVTPEMFGRFATADGKQIESNHPAFIYGHLSLYAHKIMEDLGKPMDALPAGFEQNFSKDCVCKDDPDGELPSMGTITTHFFGAWNQVLEALRATDDEAFQQPNPSEAMAKRFPTLGSVQNFYASGHNMMHLGQMSAWRRMSELGSA